VCVYGCVCVYLTDTCFVTVICVFYSNDLIANIVIADLLLVLLVFVVVSRS
jgi:hypothetical protein